MTKIEIIIDDDNLGMTENEIYDKIESCVEHDLDAVNYKIFIDVD